MTSSSDCTTWKIALSLVITSGGVLAGRTAATGAGNGQWEAPVLADVLWFAALALALRSFFEPVMVSYYPWPALAVALIPAAYGGWVRLLVAGVIAGGVTAQGQGPWHNVLAWWVPLVAGLLVLLAVAWPGRQRQVVAAAATV